jgi:2-aminoethylphosphonate-pyruvate transaminase
MILLNPGPVTLSPGVRAAMQQEDLCHREPEFASITQEVLDRLVRVHPDAADRYAAVLLTGSGSAGVEAMLSTFAPADRTTLVLCNGVYGERMAQMLSRQRKPHHAVVHRWDEAIDPARLAEAMDRIPGVATVAAVHHETTTGRLNDLDGIASLCRERGADLLVDAVSSFGAEDIPLGRWSPLAVAGTANKCLHGAPGASFVLARRDALQARRGHATTLYLDLEAYFSAQSAGGWSPFTQAVHVVLALRQALREFEAEGGWRARRDCFAARTAAVADCLAGLGVRPLLEDAGQSSSLLRAYRLPAGLGYAELHDRLKARGFVIYAGQGRLADGVFRIATMGAIGPADLDRLLAALREAMGAEAAS